ncbi:hypothetical protein NEHOM01_0367 [Nematocida homosporus]|uniref:uncharacterized protein n=1 Tax=Nematocida homosporus TaxID=1912981 RepID=UPI00221E3CA4|nr:uncharacterized protein NEHOM01_0367 [Nematocida homosporus]KAI5184765.1 hypothetical protein NEHOM01_0367 [Nematocida homosporus]
MVERNPSKVKTRVRFPVSALFLQFLSLLPMTDSDLFLKLQTESVHDIYEGLCRVEEQTDSESILGLGRVLAQNLLLETKTRKYAIYAMVEILRIAAPRNPFEEKEIETLFRHLVTRGAREVEGRRALEIVGSYRMAALLEQSKLVNGLAELALDNLGKKWAIEMIDSILEEKEEDLGRDVKMRIVKKVSEGCVVLERSIEKHPLLFMQPIEEYIVASKKRVSLVRKFNSISKEVVTREVAEKCVADLMSKKEFIQFVGSTSVRREILQVVEGLSEDRSGWVRCAVVGILFGKARDSFYTAAVAAEIKEAAVAIWMRRLHDPTAVVRASTIKGTKIEDILGVSEAWKRLLERVRDTDRSVREAALQLVLAKEKEEWQVRRESEWNDRSTCFICRDGEVRGQEEVFVPLLLSVFIDDHLEQVELLKRFVQQWREVVGSENIECIGQWVFLEILVRVQRDVESVDHLTGCASAISILELPLPELVTVCQSHMGNAAILKKVLAPEQMDLSSMYLTEAVPGTLLIMLAETYPKGSISTELMDLVKTKLSGLSEDNFYRAARMVSVSEYNNGDGWTPEISESGRGREYSEIKRMALSDGNEFSLDLSRITDHSISDVCQTSTDVQEQERKLGEYSKRMLISVQMDLFECCVRSALLEKVAVTYLLSGTYADYEYFDRSVFFRQRLTIGVRSHPDPEIRRLFSLISILVSRRPVVVFTESLLLETLSLLCWFFIEYNRVRAVEIITALFLGNTSLAQEFFSLFVNLKRFKIEDAAKLQEMYVLSEEVYAVLDKEASKIGINPAQYSNELPDGLYDRLKMRGGWATTLLLLDDNQFSANILTRFKQKLDK